MHVYIDTETRSACDLDTSGTWAYAQHPTTECILLQWRVGLDGVTQYVDDPRKMQEAIVELSCIPDVVFVAHNASFDKAIVRFVLGVVHPHWLCTAALARALSLPSSLGDLCNVLTASQDDQKDKQGAKLIKLFCAPAKTEEGVVRYNDKSSHPAEWAQFVQYGLQDVVAMAAAHKNMMKFTLPAIEHKLQEVDCRMNERGLRIDMAFVAAACALADTEKQELAAECHRLTNGAVEKPTQIKRLKSFLLSEFGIYAESLDAENIACLIANPETPELAQKLLVLRETASKSSIAKYRTLKQAVCADGRLRNALKIYGAQATGRWSGQLFQPQNLPRCPGWFDEHMQEGTIQAAINGVLPLLGGVAHSLSYALRGVVIADPGSKLVVADLSNIEGRGIAWLAGEDWKIKAFEDFDAGKGPDLYLLAYARAFGVPVESVTKDQRQIGKVMELALGYGGGVGAFLTFASMYRLNLAELADKVLNSADLDEESFQKSTAYREFLEESDPAFAAQTSRNVFIACDTLKNMWRKAHPATSGFWGACETAITQVAARESNTAQAGKHLKFTRIEDHVCAILPSGRFIVYHGLRLDEVEGESKPSISFLGVDAKTHQWERRNTYGGKEAGKLTQATARDILVDSLIRAEGQGYSPVLVVHDEIVAETPDSAAFTKDGLCEIMTASPDWARGLPLAAAGFESHRYRK